MSRTTLFLTTLISMLSFDYASAMSTHTYLVVQESITFLVSIGCLILAISIYRALKGGILGTPWVFFVMGFGLAAVGGLIKLLDLFKIFIYEYDLRPATLLTTCGSVIFLLLGLFYYRRGLE